MTTTEIINALQVLENFHAKEPQQINHYEGTDEMGRYEYFSHGEGTGTSFSTPNLHYFIDCVTQRWDTSDVYPHSLTMKEYTNQ